MVADGYVRVTGSLVERPIGYVGRSHLHCHQCTGPLARTANGPIRCSGIWGHVAPYDRGAYRACIDHSVCSGRHPSIRRYILGRFSGWDNGRNCLAA